MSAPPPPPEGVGMSVGLRVGGFGLRLKRAREDVGLRSKWLADRTSIPRSQVHIMERIDGDGRQIAAIRVYELARAAGIRMEDLMGVPYLGEPQQDPRWPAADSAAALATFIQDAGLTPNDGWTLGHVHFHERQPLTVSSWRWMWESIRRGCMFDHWTGRVD